MVTKLDEHIAKKGVVPSGPASGIYYNTPIEVPSQKLLWEVLRPIEPEIPETTEDTPGFGIKKIPGARAATIVHSGLFRHTGSTYERLEEWIGHQGLKICGPAEEIYFSSTISLDQDQAIEIRLPVCPA